MCQHRNDRVTVWVCSVWGKKEAAASNSLSSDDNSKNKVAKKQLLCSCEEIIAEDDFADQV